MKTSTSSFSVKMELCLVPVCLQGVRGGIYGIMPQINCNYQRCGASMLFMPAAFEGKKHVRPLIIYFGKERTAGFTVHCHPFGIEHLSIFEEMKGSKVIFMFLKRE